MAIGTPDQWLFALLVASSLLHFYLDGFIWKVSDRATQAPLVDEGRSSMRQEAGTPSLVHLAKWALRAAAAIALLTLKTRQLHGDPADANLARYNALASLTPDLPECQLLRSRLALQAGHVDKAVQLAAGAARQRPRSHRLLGEVGAVMLDAGHAERAKNLLCRAADLDPESWRFWLDWGRAAEQLKLKQFDEASDCYAEAVRLAGDASQPYQYQADYLLARGEPSAAVAPLREVLRRFPRDVAALRSLSSALAATGQMQQATRMVERAVAIGPDDPLSQLALGQIRLQAGMPGEAIAPLRRAVRLDPELGSAHLQRGNAFYALGKWSLASTAFQEAVARLPGDASPYVNLGSSRWPMGDLRGAEAAYQAGLRIAPDSPALHYNLGHLWLQLGRREAGQARLRLAAQLGASP